MGIVESASVYNDKNKKGLYIIIDTDENTDCGQYFQVNLYGKDSEDNPVFEVISVSAKRYDKTLTVEAKETGHWRESITFKKGFDLRGLVGAYVLPITDTKRIKEIIEQSTWL